MGKKGFKDLLVWQLAKDEVGHLRKPEYDSLEAEYEQLAKKIGSLIRARSQASSH